eukprot:COSAG01_NODE_7808_length_3047_cov_3.984396_2_plen_33_part_00
MTRVELGPNRTTAERSEADIRTTIVGNVIAVS